MQMDEAELLDRLHCMVTPFGPIAAARKLASDRRNVPAALDCVSAMIGSGAPGRPLPDGTTKTLKITGGRTIGNPVLAEVIAIAEGAERYASADILGEQRILTTVDQLDGEAIEMSTIPRCSDKEYSSGKCPLRPPDLSLPIRWVQGVNLLSGRPTWLPAIMACYGIGNPLPSELFWNRISTGFAVHTDPLEAMLNGIFEVIERDLNALVWLQKLPLPLIPDDELSDNCREVIDWAARHFIDTYLFDGTTDIGVPVAYCLRIAHHDKRVRQLVAAGSGRSLGDAAYKALLEATTGRPALLGRELQEDFSEFADIGDGARYMGRPQMAFAFDFLLEDAARRAATTRPELPADPAEALGAVLETFRKKDMPVFAVDRTCGELLAAGLTAVSIVIPGMQPMSLTPLAQYKGHARLYAAPALLGYAVHREEDLNPWPQPFH